jgi:hypothetical protein
VTEYAAAELAHEIGTRLRRVSFLLLGACLIAAFFPGLAVAVVLAIVVYAVVTTGPRCVVE